MRITSDEIPMNNCTTWDNQNHLAVVGDNEQFEDVIVTLTKHNPTLSIANLLLHVGEVWCQLQ